MVNREQKRLTSTEPLTVVRQNFSEIVEEVVSTGSEMVVSRHGRQDAVILGFDEYEALIETLNILSDPGTMSALEDADAELVAGELVDFE
jgi:prevent-host-death family protein